MAETVKYIVQLAILRPGMAMMAFSLAILLVRAWKTKSKRYNYNIKNFWKYPDDFVIVGGAGVMFVLGLVTFLWRTL